MMRKYILAGVCAVLLLSIFISCQSQDEIDLHNYISSGRDIYRTKCQSCHGENGEGLGELSPPLTDSIFLKQNKQKLACFIKNGLTGEIVINGKKFEENMPSFNELADIEIAQVIVYITNNFGNKQGMYPYQSISNDLQNCK